MIKKAISKYIFPILLLLCIVFTGCADSSVTKYRRVSFLAESAGDENTFDSAVNNSTNIEYQNKKDYGNTFTAYKISPHIFTVENLETVAKLFGVDEKATKLANGDLDIALYDGQQAIKWFTLSDNNMITCGFGRSEKAREIDKSDEELINDAKQVLDKLISSGVIGGEYECCGIVSDVTNETDESHKYFVQKRIGFRRKIDGMRIVGNEFCDMVMNAEGLYRIELCCYDYEKIETFEMLTVDQALEKAKKPDAYSVYSATNNNFSGQADVMRIENSNLVYYNQYRKDCIILQPVYYFEGQLVNEKGSVDFSVKVIAIPEKYTFEKNN